VSEKRDPRSWWIDEDPFDRLESRRPPPSHSSARDDSSRRKPHIRVVMASSGGQGGRPFFRVFGDEPRAQSIPVHKGSIWHFSEVEVRHLSLATLAFTIALGFLGRPIFSGFDPGSFIFMSLICFFALAPAFLLHEMAHKFSARYYGCWAEFRASPSGLRFGVIFAVLTGWIFMAPGAVMVVGQTTRSQFGKIALAGPVTNVILWGIGLIGVMLYSGENAIIQIFLEYWMMGNGIFALLNMLPFGPLDGKKIKAWSDSIFLTWLTICASMVWFNFTHLAGLL
tara:strand:+ start:411 stop:1256 length:846 start_codon:yes stop_codon:yes gene_type:complete